MNKKFKIPELLAPAGSLEKLKVAFLYGADAVFFGGEAFSLRGAAQNFTFDDIKEGVEFAHERGKKIYCTVNVMPRSKDLEKLKEYLIEIDKLGVDGVIISDLGVLRMVKKYTKLPIHISTQANTINYEGCNMWEDLGAERIVLARECSLNEIKEIRENISEDLELEVFVHGAMCISYSGRCLLSNFMAGRERDSNRGFCAQSCRWKYSLVEEKRKGEYFPIEEDSHGTYIMNSKDLCLLEHIPEIMTAGISSLKIEGRNKSEYYVAVVVNAYRKAIDLYLEDPENYSLPQTILDEMYKVSHRIYHTGFFFDEPKEEGLIYHTNNHIREWDVVGLVLDYDKSTGIATCRQRNKFVLNDVVSVLSPQAPLDEFKVLELFDEEGNEIEDCKHPGMIFKIKMPFEVEKYSFIRKQL